VDDTRQLFARHELKCTRQRLALYRALCECRSHPTAEELYRMFQGAGLEAAGSVAAAGHEDSSAGEDVAEGMSRATVYNTLEALCRAGLVRRLPSENGACRFDGDTSDHLHLHVRENGSEQIRDIPPSLGERLLASIPREAIDAIEREMGVHIEGLSIDLFARSGVSSNGADC